MTTIIDGRSFGEAKDRSETLPQRDCQDQIVMSTGRLDNEGLMDDHSSKRLEEAMASGTT